MRFTDRASAGRQLADAVARLLLRAPVVLRAARGGVPVAHEVARVLGAPLDVLVVRKLGVPSRPELGFGAIGEGGVRVLNESVVRAARVRESDVLRVEEAERAVLEARLRRYRGQRAAVPLGGRAAVLVDDGIATGSTASAACRVARARGAAVVVAVPVAPPEALGLLREEADEVVCLSSPEWFTAVGQWYDDFSQTSDEEVAALLARHTATAPTEPRGPKAASAAGDAADGPGPVGVPGPAAAGCRRIRDVEPSCTRPLRPHSEGEVPCPRPWEAPHGDRHEAAGAQGHVGGTGLRRPLVRRRPPAREAPRAEAVGIAEDLGYGGKAAAVEGTRHGEGSRATGHRDDEGNPRSPQSPEAPKAEVPEVPEAVGTAGTARTAATRGAVAGRPCWTGPSEP